MIQFYGPRVAVAGELPPEEAAHCIRVLRHQPGDEITVVDGHGKRYVCRIIAISKKSVNVSILSTEEVPAHWGAPITLAIAPTKNVDRMEWLVEKAVEMGVDRIVLLECERSERRHMRTERLEKIMVSAMKQSLKATLPELSGPVALGEFLKEKADKEELRFVAHCDADSLRENLSTAMGELGSALHDTPVTILIGPEGDFSPMEIKKAIGCSYRPVSLGDSRLRTETAAMFSLAAVHTLRQLYGTGKCLSD